MSSLARGTDQLFANLVLGLGGGLEVILTATSSRACVVLIPTRPT